MIARDIVLKPEFSIDVEPDATTLYDLSRYRNNGTFHGAGTPNYVKEPSGLWIKDYNGTSAEIQIPDSPSLTLLTATFEIWGTLAQQPGDFPQVARVLFEKTNSYRFFIDRGTLALRTILYDGGATGYGGANTVWILNRWYYFVCTIDGTNVTFYIDGQVDASPAQTNDPAITANDLWIGASAGGAYWWYGKTGGEGIRNYALTAGQVRNRYETIKHWFGVHD